MSVSVIFQEGDYFFIQILAVLCLDNLLLHKGEWRFATGSAVFYAILSLDVQVRIVLLQFFEDLAGTFVVFAKSDLHYHPLVVETANSVKVKV